MILVISLNPCLDRICFINEFKTGMLNRSQRCVVSAGGKGVNVAKVLSALGEQVQILGFFAGSAGRYIIETMQKLNIETYPVWQDGQETRTTVNIMDTATGLETEITEPGPIISYEKICEFFNIYNVLVQKSDLVVMSGSAPVGIEDDIYKRLIVNAKEYAKTTVLDTASGLLKAGIEANPDYIKPNIRELNDLTKETPNNPGGVFGQIDYLHNKGVKNICLSMGKAGAILSCEKNRYSVKAFDVNVVNTIGSGDSMTAGIAASVKRGYGSCELLTFSSACAASNACFEGIGIIDKEQVERLFSLGKCEKI